MKEGAQSVPVEERKGDKEPVVSKAVDAVSEKESNGDVVMKESEKEKAVEADTAGNGAVTAVGEGDTK